MATNHYAVTVSRDQRFTFTADFAQASSPIMLDGSSTPFQVADARHSPDRAAQMLIDWTASEGGAAVGEDEEWELVDLAE